MLDDIAGYKIQACATLDQFFFLKEFPSQFLFFFIAQARSFFEFQKPPGDFGNVEPQFSRSAIFIDQGMVTPSSMAWKKGYLLI